MQEPFMLEDLLDVLIRLETLGNRHYEKLATLTEIPELKKLFTRLAGQELAHKKIYEQYLEELVTFEQGDVTEEYQAFAEALLKDTISFLNRRADFDSFETGYQIAIHLEKETLLFLSEMKGLIGADSHVEINHLMDQERQHLTFLLNYRPS